MKKEHFYRPDVDGLRAFAVLSVVFYHAKLPFITGGFIGVDIFFVISGFLITKILLKEIAQGSFTFIGFYERRARRIFPALFAMMLVVLCLGLIWYSPEQLQTLSQSLVAVSTFLSNIFFWLKTDYFTNVAAENPLIHTWSLAVEEQFYIVFPVFLLLIFWLKKTLLPVAVVAMLGLSLAASIFLQEFDAQANFYWPIGRAWELMLGALVAIYDKPIVSFKISRPKLSSIMATFGFIMMMAGVFLYSKATPFPGLAAIPPVLGTALVIAFCVKDSNLFKLLTVKSIVFVGLISYSLYLWHQPIFTFTKHHWQGQLPMPLNLLLVVISCVCAYLSWRFIETPFRDKKRFTRNKIMIGSFIVISGFVLVGLAGHVGKGLPERFPQHFTQLSLTAEHSPKRLACHTEGLNYTKPELACSYGEGEPKWAVWGDSHAVELAWELGNQLEARNESVLHFSFSGCPPSITMENDNPGCKAWNNDVLAHLKAAKNVEQVVLVHRHSFYLFGDQVSVFPELPNSQPVHLSQYGASDARRLYFDDLRIIINTLLEADKTVILLTPIPELVKSINRHIYHIGWDMSVDSNALSDLNLEYYHRRNRLVLSQFEALPVNANLVQVASQRAFCSNSDCLALSEEGALYFDDNHLSLLGASKLSKLILKQWSLSAELSSD